MASLMRLLLWAAAFAAIALFAATAWGSYRRRQHQRAVDSVLGWARASVTAGMELESARAALLGQGFFPLVEQSGGERNDEAILFAKDLHDFPLLHPVEVRVRLLVDENGRVRFAEHQAVQAPR